MAKDVDQRQIPTAQYKVGQLPPHSPGGDSGPDDITDESLSGISAVSDPALTALASQWRFNALSAVLATALCCALLFSLALWIKLSRARADLAEAELAAEMAEAAVAREPSAAEDDAVARAGAAAGAAAAGSKIAGAPTKVEAVSLVPAALAEGAQAAANTTASDRLVLLLTVGTQHFAEKQLRRLRKQCRASLAVYQQRRGRCGWSQCFAVAAPEADAGLARGCGQVKGQALRDRGDFVVP